MVIKLGFSGQKTWKKIILINCVFEKNSVTQCYSFRFLYYTISFTLAKDVTRKIYY